MKRILVPVDFSDESAHALRFAGRLAQHHGATVRLLYADYFVPPVDFSSSAAIAFAITSDEAADSAKKLLIHTAEEQLPKGVSFETRVVIDAPVAAIVDEARHCGADLVIMGTHGRTGFRRLVLGSVTETVMRMVNLPLITVSPKTASSRIAATLPRIVVAVDYTAECREALLAAAAIADPGARIVCVRNVKECDDPTIAAAEICRMQAWTPPEILERCQYKVLPDDHPAEQVLELAKLVRADLIVTGLTSKRTTTEVVRGTLSERLVERADCPVLAVNEMTVAACATTALPVRVGKS
jgi:nucleotide-binding universal stress UspA family protein